MSYQKVMILGNLGNDPDMKYTPQGKAVCNFSLAVSKKYTKADGEKVDETIWWRVSVWGAQAESCHKYLKKGSQVFVEGEMKAPRVYEHKNEHRCDLEMTGNRVVFLSSKE